MSAIVVPDGTTLFYKDFGAGQPVVFSHGWPLNSDAWDVQMMFFGARGFRVVAHDRRGHGRSGQTWAGNDMNTYADDLAELLDQLDLHDVTLIGHSTGGGEVARYIGRHGTERLARVVLLGAVPPLMLQTAANPGGLPRSAFDKLRQATLADRSQFFRDLAMPFYGYNRQGASPSQGVIDFFWLQGMQAGIKAAYDCIEQFSEVDFTQDLKAFDVPTLILHGDHDQIVPIGASALQSAQLIPGATLKVYRGAPHGIATTHADQFNGDVLEFIQAAAERGAPLHH
jgi:non-heme chloroperoxidase